MSEQPTQRAQSFAIKFWGIVLGVMLAIGGLTWGYVTYDNHQQRQVCERTVRAREDGRAVWLYLVARDPDRADDPDVVEFVDFLNERLPALHCVDGNPTPIESP